MPIKSKAQARFLAANHPGILKKWMAETPEINQLPEHKKKRKILDRKR